MRVLLIDDHTMFREGLVGTLTRSDASIVVDEASGCDEAAGRRGTDYDLILLDLKLPGMEDIEALQRVRELFPETPVVVVSGVDDAELVWSTISAGAMGFVSKAEPTRKLRSAMEVILDGGVYLPRAILDGHAVPSVHAPSSAPNGGAAGLSARQREVLRWTIQGKSNKEIARKISVTESTVKQHLQRVFAALGVRNRTEAVVAAGRLGWRL